MRALANLIHFGTCSPYRINYRPISTRMVRIDIREVTTDYITMLLKTKTYCNRIIITLTYTMLRLEKIVNIGNN